MTQTVSNERRPPEPKNPPPWRASTLVTLEGGLGEQCWGALWVTMCCYSENIRHYRWAFFKLKAFWRFLKAFWEHFEGMLRAFWENFESILKVFQSILRAFETTVRGNMALLSNFMFSGLNLHLQCLVPLHRPLLCLQLLLMRRLWLLD